MDDKKLEELTFASKQATSGHRCPLRITKMKSGGAIL